ncbi:mandelate racemase/muconate lactonizing enzyme family protein [Streptomyces sp. NPDC050560]|uniref:mandelate racemase/muconate lactonizing enzyme family protein n=1 Tax=Streptomyces sp. NPDC050560 TaxID=3365630 RepID=UPI00378BA8B6
MAADRDTSPLGLLAAAPPVVDAAVHRVVLRKSDPAWRFALAANPESPGLLLRLSAGDGTTGIGFASEVRHLGHDLGPMRAALGRALPVLTGADRDPRPLAALDTAGGPARAVLQMALLDLVARHRGVPAHALLGERLRDGVELTRILALKSPEEMAAIAKGHAAEGYRHAKIKLDHGDGDLDHRRVAAIRDAVGPGFGLTVDANQSYRDPADALALAERLVPLGVLLFEQPVPARDLTGLRWLTERSPIPIEADEAADSPERVRRIAESGAAHGVSIKIPKLGGVDRAAAAARLCAAAGLRVRLGAHVGSRLLNAAAVHLAVTVDGLEQPAELAEFARLEGDPVAGVEVVGGTLAPPEGPGLGAWLRDDTLLAEPPAGPPVDSPADPLKKETP